MEQQSQDNSKGYFIDALVEKLFRKFSLFGDKEFFNKKDFPIAKLLEDNYETIKKEFDELDKRTKEFAVFHEISDDQLFISDDEKWRLFFLKAVTVRFDKNCEQMPKTMKLLDSDNSVVSVYLSVLGPRKMLMPHRGPWSGIFRVHLGLKIPEDGCTLVVNGKEYKWREGEAVVFDDTYEHIAVNMTEQERTVLFIDFMRPLPFPLKALNWVCLRSARYVPYFRGYMKRIKDWENAFYKAAQES